MLFVYLSYYILNIFSFILMLYHRMNIVLMHDVFPNLEFETSRLGVPQTSGIGCVECQTLD